MGARVLPAMTPDAEETMPLSDALNSLQATDYVEDARVVEQPYGNYLQVRFRVEKLAEAYRVEDNKGSGENRALALARLVAEKREFALKIVEKNGELYVLAPRDWMELTHRQREFFSDVLNQNLNRHPSEIPMDSASRMLRGQRTSELSCDPRPKQPVVEVWPEPKRVHSSIGISVLAC